MATNTLPIFLKSVESPAIQFTSADTTATKTLFTAGADGGAVTQITATSSDSVAIVVVLTVNSNIIGEVSVPAGSGTNGTLKATTLIDSDKITFFQNDGSILLGGAVSFEVNCKATMTTGTLAVTAMGGSYSA